MLPLSFFNIWLHITKTITKEIVIIKYGKIEFFKNK